MRVQEKKKKSTDGRRWRATMLYRRCIYLYARMTENDGVGRRRKYARIRVYDFRDGPGPDGCCARVRINLRLLVKIRALSFHLCAGWFARLASSNVCVSGPRLRSYWCRDIYMRCRDRRSGTPVDFLSKKRRKEREREPTLIALSCVLFILKLRKEILERIISILCRSLIPLDSILLFMFLWREIMFELYQVKFLQDQIMPSHTFFFSGKKQRISLKTFRKVIYFRYLLSYVVVSLEKVRLK